MNGSGNAEEDRADSPAPVPGNASQFARMLDQYYVRLVVGIALGLPVTMLAFLGAIYGFSMAYGGLVGGRNPALSAIALGLTLLVFAGLFGAWRRILQPRARMTSKDARTTRAFLVAGTIAAILMATGLLVWFKAHAFAAVFLFIGTMGVVLILATPADYRLTSGSSPRRTRSR